MSEADLLVVILAAGASRRLGMAKQLVSIGGEPLLRRQCRSALAAQVGEVAVILGFNADQHRTVIEDLPVKVRVNENWGEGLAATLRCAIGVARSPQTALLLVACDQYRILATNLRAISDRWRLQPSRPCISRTGTYAGPPVILPTQYHDQVLRLRRDVGARSVLYQKPESSPIDIRNPRASVDLDSLEDLRIANAWIGRRSA